MRTSLLLTCLLPLLATAQDPTLVWHPTRAEYPVGEEAPPAYVLGSDVVLRAEPSTTAAARRTLAPGTRLSIEKSNADTITMHGLRSPWYHVSVGNGTGWLWGGHIATQAFGSKADPSVKFVAGRDHYGGSDTGHVDLGYRITAVRDGKELDRIVVRSFTDRFRGVENLGSCGLKNVDDVIVLHVPCEGGCGCSTGEVVVFWSGGRLHHVADLIGTADGGFGADDRFIYPSDMEGEAGAIIRETSDYRNVEASEDERREGVEQVERIVRRQRLIWNGDALVRSGAPVERRYRVVVK